MLNLNNGGFMFPSNKNLKVSAGLLLGLTMMTVSPANLFAAEGKAKTNSSEAKYLGGSSPIKVESKSKKDEDRKSVV